ncbi:hypothetical protein Hanom_Chr01g00024061 [Helianthus anomalus]
MIGSTTSCSSYLTAFCPSRPGNRQSCCHPNQNQTVYCFSSCVFPNLQNCQNHPDPDGFSFSFSPSCSSSYVIDDPHHHQMTHLFSSSFLSSY